LTSSQTQEIHLWFAFPEAIRDEEALSEYRRMMSPEERRRYQRFHFEKHRHQFLVSRGLMRTMLSRYTQIRPEDLRFSKNRHGRPEIDGTDVSSGLRFNLSHTDGLVACAVVWRHDIGVDVEDTQRRVEFSKIADRFFSPREMCELRTMTPERKRLLFFDFWTLKEAYLKARGSGLSLPLDSCSFHRPGDDRISVLFDARMKEEPSRWLFWTLSPTARHRAALAVHWGTARAPTLRMNRVVPLMEEQAFDCPITGSSR